MEYLHRSMVPDRYGIFVCRRKKLEKLSEDELALSF
jgi:hypothetical protein